MTLPRRDPRHGDLPGARVLSSRRSTGGARTRSRAGTGPTLTSSTPPSTSITTTRSSATGSSPMSSEQSAGSSPRRTAWRVCAGHTASGRCCTVAVGAGSGPDRPSTTISCAGSSPPPGRTSCGSPTSPSTRPRRQALPVRDQGRLLEPDRRLLDRRPDDGVARRVGAPERDRAPRPSGTVVHSDAAVSSGLPSSCALCASDGLVGSMGRDRDVCGQRRDGVVLLAAPEERARPQRWSTRQELRIAIVIWIERTYHRRRRQRALGKLTPIEFETVFEVAHAA